ncbi:MAG: potassium channel protein, partial [Candidatus Heimdallarchaeota archaeon]|nr:potassium channel protein [Candidatus Heimdallarchaeota archaeon]
GELREMSQPGRIFTIVLIMFGFALFGYSLTSLTRIVVEGEIRNIFRNRKIEKEISNMKNHVILCGHGRLGREIAGELKKWRKEYVVIEMDETVGQELIDQHVPVVIGDATEDETLIKAGIKDAEGAIAALTDDVKNLFVTLTARKLNPGLTIVTKADQEGSEAKLISAGANKVISPAQIGGRRMASVLINPEVINFLDVVVSEKEFDLSMQEVRIQKNSIIEGLPIKDAQIPREIKVIGMKKGDGNMQINPPATQELSADSVLIVLGENVYIEKLLGMAKGKV